MQRAAHHRAGLARDALHHPGIGDVLDEDRADLLAPDLADQPGDVGGRGLAVGVPALRGQELEAVGGSEIAEGVMRADHPALLRRQRGEVGANAPVQRRQFGIVGRGAAAQQLGLGRPRRHQRIADARHIVAGVGDVLPGMRIGRTAAALGRTLSMAVAMCVTSMVMSGLDRRGAGLEAVAAGQHRPAVAGRADQPGHPALEAQAVDDDQIGLGQTAHIRRRGLEDMRVGIRPDQRRDLGHRTGDLRGQIGQDGEARHHPQRPVGGGGRPKRSAEQRRHRPQRGAASQVRRIRHGHQQQEAPRRSRPS